MKDDGKRFVRGGRKYIRPYGWNRVALNVKDKYDNTEWIGGVKGTIRTGSVDKEWPVSYHGTKDTFAKVIAADGYDLRKGERFKYGKGELTSITIAKDQQYYFRVKVFTAPLTLPLLRITPPPSCLVARNTRC